jgi:hypothetical protein
MRLHTYLPHDKYEQFQQANQFFYIYSAANANFTTDTLKIREKDNKNLPF